MSRRERSTTAFQVLPWQRRLPALKLTRCGVTSVENSLPVDRHTLFALGSVTKTFTATTLMRLEADGRIKLDAPVRHDVPEFELADEDAANKITVKNLLNHTAGLDWRVDADTGEGNDALALGVTALRKSRLIAPPGSRVIQSGWL